MKKLIFAVTFSLIFIGLLSQETTSSSGGEASGDEGTVSYTLGQVVYNTNTGTSGSISEGVQQSFQISVVGGVEELEISLQISAYPNPVTDILILDIDEGRFVKGEKWMVSLYDINGALLKQRIIDVNIQILDLTDIDAAIYLLKVESNNREIKTFKIIKNKKK